MPEQMLQLKLEEQAAKVEHDKSNTELNKAKVLQLGHASGIASLEAQHAAVDPDCQHQKAGMKAGLQLHGQVN